MASDRDKVKVQASVVGGVSISGGNINTVFLSLEQATELLGRDHPAVVEALRIKERQLRESIEHSQRELMKLHAEQMPADSSPELRPFFVAPAGLESRLYTVGVSLRGSPTSGGSLAGPVCFLPDHDAARSLADYLNWYVDAYVKLYEERT